MAARLKIHHAQKYMEAEAHWSHFVVYLGRYGKKAALLQMFEGWMPWSLTPLYAVLHESIYCQKGSSAWAAERIREQQYKDTFDAVKSAESGQPVLFTGAHLLERGYLSIFTSCKMLLFAVDVGGSIDVST